MKPSIPSLSLVRSSARQTGFTSVAGMVECLDHYRHGRLARHVFDGAPLNECLVAGTMASRENSDHGRVRRAAKAGRASLLSFPPRPKCWSM